MPKRLLVAHFLRQLLDNDLITPGADRHHVLSVTAASLVSAGAFLTVALSIKYLFSPIQSPAETALVALDDVCLMSGLSMIVLGLVALTAWDRLSLDARDSAIFGPLPLPPRHLAAAQVTALVSFAGVFAVVLNAGPSVLMPLVRLSRLHVGALSVLQLMAAQAVATFAAGVFGFVVIVAIREMLRAMTRNAWLSRLSVVMQSALVVSIVIALLGLPAVSSQVAHRWIDADADGRVPPPVWFAGLYDWMSGGRLEGMPPTMPPRDAPAFDSILQFERGTAARYARARPRLAAHGSTAVRALLVVAGIALLAWAWNSRRVPQLSAIMEPRRGRLRPERWIARNQMTRAGTQLVVQTLSRSTPHRLVVAATFGIAVALAAVAARTLDLGTTRPIAELPLGALAAQTIFVLTVLIGVWHACRIPASLPATPSFLLAWSGNVRLYVTGVRRAAAASGVASVLVLVPLHIITLGTGAAAWHGLFGLLMVAALSSVLFAEGNRLPLVSPYEPSGNVMGLLPIYLAIAAALVLGVAWIEREALQTRLSSAVFALTLGVVWAGLNLAMRRRDNSAAPDVLDETSMWETQHLSLSE